MNYYVFYNIFGVKVKNVIFQAKKNCNELFVTIKTRFKPNLFYNKSLRLFLFCLLSTRSVKTPPAMIFLFDFSLEVFQLF